MGSGLSSITAEFEEELMFKIFSQDLDFDLEQITIELTSLPALQLRSLLLSGAASLTDVVKTFHLKKRIERNFHRALTDAFYEQPMEQAMQIDDMTSYSKEQLPLLGFVLSLKDTILMRDTRSTWGLADNFHHFCREETPFIEYLKSKGAVIMSKSNVPQLLASFDTINNVFGEASNPLDNTRTPGGSSGGEAAALLLGLSNLGVGTDSAGSLRVPAFFCGLHSIRVTSHRFDSSIVSSPLEFKPDVMEMKNFTLMIGTVAGPIAKTVTDLEAFLLVYNEYNRVNRELPPIPWRKFPAKRRIGMLKELKMIPLPAVCRRAMNMCLSRLRDHDYEIIELSIEEIEYDLLKTVFATFLKNELLVELIQKKHHVTEPIISVNHSQVSALKRLSCTLKLAKRFLSERKRLFVEAILLSRQYNNMFFAKKMNMYREYFLDLFARNRIELALFYGLPPAFKKGTSGKCTLLASYLVIWNFLDFVAGALTVTRVRNEEQFYQSDWADEISETIGENMAQSKGLPVGVQVVGLPFCEEKVVDLMRELEGDYQTRSETSSVIGDLENNKGFFSPI